MKQLKEDNELVEQLRSHAAVIRNFLERTPEKSKWDCSLEEYPRGACWSASMLLAAYLLKKGFKKVHFANGGNPQTGLGSHAWLVVEGYIIDITSDQFIDVEPMKPSVVVTRNFTWYDENFSNYETTDVLNWGGEVRKYTGIIEKYSSTLSK